MPDLVRCIVVDDEPLAVELLADYIGKTPGLQLALKTTHVLEALQQVQEGKADLLFLDIQMPELTGIQFMKIMRNACPVVLTTAYAEYALEGYEFDVVDYLLKPVTFERFMVAVEKAKRRLEKAENNLPQPVSSPHIFIKTEYRIQKIDLADILYIEALRDYIAIHTANGKIMSLESLKNMEEILPANNFIRIHKSYIINKNKIEFLERGKVIINKQYLPVGETYKEKFLTQIKMI
jgi:two-component system, LytTR family, response regulator